MAAKRKIVTREPVLDMVQALNLALSSRGITIERHDRKAPPAPQQEGLTVGPICAACSDTSLALHRSCDAIAFTLIVREV